MKNMLVSSAALAMIAGAASANQLPSTSVNSLRAEATTNLTSPRGPGYTENFESFTLGNPNQAGWTGTLNVAIVDSGVPGFGARTAATTSSGSGLGAFEFRSPTVGVQSSLAADVLINDAGALGTTLFQLLTVDSVGGFFNTRINFNSDGSIEALQAVGGVGVFAATTGSWAVGQTTRVGVEVLGDGTLNVYQDNSVIFTGVDINFAIGGASNGVDSIGNFSLNDAGTGADVMLMDNIGAIPAPGVAAVFGLAGLAGLRRRR
jgi:hypothetical protein